MKRLAVPLVGLGLVAGLLLGWGAPATEAAPPVTVVQYQGRLTDANGKPLEGTVAKLTFRLYSATSPLDSSTFVWGESHLNVAVRRGVFSLQLGLGQLRVDAAGNETPGNNPLTTNVLTGGDRFLQVQVNADPPLSPPTRLGAVPFAVAAGGSTPVGGIIEWFRPDTTTPVPDGWAPCDGRLITDPDSLFNNKRVPDLTNRFSRGLAPSHLQSGYGAQPDPAGPLLPEVGGSASVSLDHNHGAGSLRFTIGQDAGHTHNVPARNTDFITICDPNKVSLCPAFFGGPFGDHKHNVPAVDTNTAGAHDHGGQTSSGSGQTSNGGGSVTVLPPYVGLIKLIRIK